MMAYGVRFLYRLWWLGTSNTMGHNYKAYPSGPSHKTKSVFQVCCEISFGRFLCYLSVCFSCPFDFVKVYDGADNQSATVGTYCGQQRNLVLYSSNNFMLVSFVTLQRTATTQNRGFKGIFEFSESFVKLGEQQLPTLRKFYVATAKIKTSEKTIQIKGRFEI